MNENQENNLIIEDSDDNINHEEINNLFISSESSKSSESCDSSESNKKNKIKIPKNISIDTNFNEINSNEKVKDATTGIDIFDNDIPEFIDENKDTMQNIDIPIKSKNEDINDIFKNMLKKDDKNINGWDSDANITITNWYKTFKQQSFIYQFVLDKNRRMADILAIISIISSASLGIFSGFKLWIDNDIIFQTISNILLMLLNFLVALITASSKRYIDDKRNEKIRVYVEEIDIFLGELSAQVLNSPVYRMNADKFFKLNNTKYTKLISSAPNLSISEINEGKQKFLIYKEHCHYNI